MQTCMASQCFDALETCVTMLRLLFKGQDVLQQSHDSMLKDYTTQLKDQPAKLGSLLTR